MDKISHILPGSARTQAADISTSQPARPGAPATGRVEGKVTPRTPSLDVSDKVSLSGAMPGDAKVEDSMPTYKNNRAADAARSKVVDDLAKKFFDTKSFKDIREDSAGSETAVANAEVSQEAANSIAGLKQG